MAWDPWNSAKKAVKNVFKSPLGKIAGIALAVAIPFAAPTMVGMLGGTTWGASLLSGLSNLGMSYAGITGLTGAVAGGLLGAATGSGWERGALFGGLGGYARGSSYLAGQGAGAGSGAGGTGNAGSAGAGVAPPGTAGSTILGPNATVTPSGVTTANPSLGQQSMQVLKNASDTLKAKITNPDFLADITLRAAGSLASGALAGDGLTPEEQEFLRAQTEEMQRIQQTNQALYEERLAEARRLIGESKWYDPEYFGQQAARRAGLQGAAIRQEATRGLTGTNLQAERRKVDLGTARNVGTAYDSGYATGVQGRLQTQIAGINAMPTDYGSSALYAAQLPWNMFNTANERRRQASSDIANLFELSTDPQKQSTGGTGTQQPQQVAGVRRTRDDPLFGFNRELA